VQNAAVSGEVQVKALKNFYDALRRTLNNKTRKETRLKFYKVVALSTLLYRN
jgi:hypothetical protein